MSDKLKNFIVRTLSGAVLLLIVLGASFAGYVGYALLLGVITLGGVVEFYRLAQAKGIEPQRGWGVVSAMLMYLAGACVGGGFVLGVDVEEIAGVGLFGAGILLFALALILLIAVFFTEVFRNRTNPMLNIATTIMGVVYVGLPMSLMVIVPLLLGGLGVWSAWYFICYLFLVWGNDIFAYLVGVTMGRHKMCERLSPKKSWEGFVGGVLGSLAMGAVGAMVTDGSYGLWLGLALVVSLSSVVGDLVESMFKRDAGVKDSGRIMPGHGGILDRFDALILSAPCAFIYLCIAVFALNI
jgi:phosphatidate cytidylyltransferase